MLGPRRRIKFHNQSGMALVLTLMAVSFLVAITVQLTTSVNWQMQGAGNLRDSVQLDAVTRSGLSLARAALLADLKNNNFDSEHDSWGVKLSEDAPSLFGQGELAVKVDDLSGLLQVNALVPVKKQNTGKPNPPGQPNPQQVQQAIQINLWKRLLTRGNFDLDDDEALEIIDAIIDWIDEDETVYNNGAESGYYQSLSPPYTARNAPVTYLEDLLLIRGMTEEIFSGIKVYLTEAGSDSDGTININTAPKELLMVLDPSGNMTEQTRDELVEFRQNEDNKNALENPRWYMGVNGSPNFEEDQQGLIGVKSKYFKVSVTAKHKNMTRTGTGILERVQIQGKDEQILQYWEVR